ncbi:hypothetical protein PENVUL_c010G05739 [Penicillium vulpinum]|uniref:DUF7587 domain-containing protein n=2 Tax=Penicillium vulpinum TaxID=29845 RepID=A0A1V6S2V4_9EURO|nr:hypothetical protein PENVUL_c010G05739 [Penicillium vulpinum]
MEGEWKSITQRIKSTAVTLHLPLLEKTADDIDTSQWGTRATMVGLRTESPPQTPHIPHIRSLTLRQRSEEERSHYFAESGDQRSESITMSAGNTQEQIDHLEEIDPNGNDKSVVTSHGKMCLWCNHDVIIDETECCDDQCQQNDPEQNKIPDQTQQPQHRRQEHQDWSHQDQHPEEQNQYSKQQDQYLEHQVCGQQNHDQGQDHPNRQGYHWDHDLAMQGVPADKLPPLLFRWSNHDSQGVNTRTLFLAGLFCNAEWFHPEDVSESQFESFFQSHVTKEKTKTPFISTCQSPLSPFHRAVAGQNGAMITIIDTSKLNTKVFYAYPLAIRTRTLILRGWKGFGEYLIWGHIPTEAIAFTVDIASLQQIVRSHRDVNRLVQIPLISSSLRCDTKLRDMLALKRKSPFRSGRTLGKLLTLLQVPAIYWENLATEFAKGWGWRHKKEISLFHRGIQSAPPYQSEELTDSESEAPWPTPQKTPGSTPQKMYFSSDRISDWMSDVDYEPPETDEESGEISESEDMAESGSMSICDQTETEDDGKFSTHETLSSGISPDDYGAEHPLEQVHSQEVIDLISENDETSSQRALQRDWPSDDDTYMYHETPTKIRGNLPQSDNKVTNHLLLNGHTDMDFFGKVRN